MKYLIAAIALVVFAPAPIQAHNEIVLDLIDKIELENRGAYMNHARPVTIFNGRK